MVLHVHHVAASIFSQGHAFGDEMEIQERHWHLDGNSYHADAHCRQVLCFFDLRLKWKQQVQPIFCHKYLETIGHYDMLLKDQCKQL